MTCSPSAPWPPSMAAACNHSTRSRPVSGTSLQRAMMTLAFASPPATAPQSERSTSGAAGRRWPGTRTSPRTAGANAVYVINHSSGGAGGGAVTSLVAGSGISLAPASGVGDVTITATGGGGSSVFDSVRVRRRRHGRRSHRPRHPVHPDRETQAVRHRGRRRGQPVRRQRQRGPGRHVDHPPPLVAAARPAGRVCALPGIGLGRVRRRGHGRRSHRPRHPVHRDRETQAVRHRGRRRGQPGRCQRQPRLGRGRRPPPASGRRSASARRLARSPRSQRVPSRSILQSSTARARPAIPSASSPRTPRPRNSSCPASRPAPRSTRPLSAPARLGRGRRPPPASGPRSASGRRLARSPQSPASSPAQASASRQPAASAM